MVGVWFFRYHVEMVEGDKLERIANSYSDQFRDRRSLVISFRISFHRNRSISFSFVKDYKGRKRIKKLDKAYIFFAVTQ